MEKLENWKRELAEYGALHNEDCCVNTEYGCDCDVKDDECCENIEMASAFVKEHSRRLIGYISHDMKIEDEEKRKAVVEMYIEHFKF